MSFDFARFMQLDFPAFAAGALAAMACGLIGAFLVLRRMSLMGDAISHAVLPGIVAAFLLADSLAALPIFIGAAVVGVITSLLTELIHRLGKVEPGASMGVVFTVLFAAGVLWLEQIGGSSIHLDADCVLYGNMQTVIWPDAPATLGEGLTLGAWSTTPRQLVTLLAGQRHRLVEHDVDPRVGERPRDLEVRVVRRDDRDEVDPVLGSAGQLALLRIVGHLRLLRWTWRHGSSPTPNRGRRVIRPGAAPGPQRCPRPKGPR